MADLPEWECRNEAQRRALTAWTLRQVDGLLEVRLATQSDSPGAVEAVAALSDAFDRAREEMPWLTYEAFQRYRQPPVTVTAGAPKKALSDRITDVANAALDHRLIREVWQAAYGRDRRTEAPTAEEIAAAKWAVSEETLANYLRGPRHKRPDRDLLRP